VGVGRYLECTESEWVSVGIWSVLSRSGCRSVFGVY